MLPLSTGVSPPVNIFGISHFTIILLIDGNPCRLHIPRSTFITIIPQRYNDYSPSLRVAIAASLKGCFKSGWL
ncbi:MAG: hypothetical protein V7K42_09080 [Nostoc sp.]